MANDESERPPTSGQVEASEAHDAGIAPVTPEVTPVFRGTGVSTALVVGVVLALLATIVSLQNTEDVEVDFLAWDINAPLVAILLAAVLAGVLLDESLGFFWRRHRRRHLAERAELRRLRRLRRS